MKRCSILISLLALVTLVSVKAQDANTLVKIADKDYSIQEFDFIYGKNNSYSEEPKTKKEYVDLFVNYKLKVHEAIAQGIDTTPSFLKEFNYYKDELAKPYLSDKNVTDKLKKEAYHRLTKEVDASHILIKVDKSAAPEDTLKAYNRIKEISDRIKNGEDFAKLAKENSEDPSAVQNKGRLGYFSGFMMVYPFESAAYNTPVGELSDIIRTDFGYHLIYVHDKRDNRGELRTAHIMQMFPKDSPESVVASKKAKIDSIYQLILQGEDFGTLAQNHSDDKNSARNNGELQWFGTGRMIPEFSEPAFELDSVGSISKVIRTPYGFHIIKLLEKRGVNPYEEMEEEIEKRLARDERGYKEKEVVIERLKKEYNFEYNNDALDQLKTKLENKELSIEDIYSSFDDSKSAIATLDAKPILLTDLLEYLKKDRRFKYSRVSVFNEKLDSFIGDEVINYEKSRLEDKYEEYKFLVQEYHDGLLIFEISQKEIWNKAAEDSTGIINYYNNNKDLYYYPEKLVGNAIFTKDKKTLKQVKSIVVKNPSINADSIKSLVDKKAIKVLKGEFEKGEYKAIDALIWKDKKSKGKVEENFPFVYAWGEKKLKEPKKFEDTKGQVIADYQTEIEKKWLTTLKEKYKPTVNLKTLKLSKKKLK